MKNNLYIVSLLLLLLSSCSFSNYDKKSIAEISSSSIGGYFGYQLSDADIFSTVIGSAAGFLVGSYIGDFLLKNDYYYYKTSLLQTLETNQINSSGYWKNHKTGSEGVILVKNYFMDPECRLIEHKFIVKKKANSFLDTACRKNDGSWTVN